MQQCQLYVGPSLLLTLVWQTCFSPVLLMSAHIGIVAFFPKRSPPSYTKPETVTNILIFASVTS
jgi:hypothetical protein